MWNALNIGAEDGRKTVSGTEKGKTMKPYEIVMLAILVALEIPAIIILSVGWVKACKEAREREGNDGT